MNMNKSKSRRTEPGRIFFANSEIPGQAGDDEEGAVDVVMNTVEEETTPPPPS